MLDRGNNAPAGDRIDFVKKRREACRPARDLGPERRVGRCQVPGFGQSVAVGQAKRMLGRQPVAIIGRQRWAAAHSSRHPLSRCKPRRIQLFIVPSGTASRAAKSG